MAQSIPIYISIYHRKDIKDKVWCNLTHKIRKSGLGGKRRKRTKISVKNVENNEKKMKKKWKKASRFG